MGGQRKAWNEAMMSAAGAAALPPALQPRTTKRRSDRRKKQDRRDKARKVQSVTGDDGGEGAELLAAAWMDALEDITASGAVSDDDDSYDEFDDGGEAEGTGGGSANNKRKKTGGGAGGGGGGGRSRGGASNSKSAAAAGVLPKRFKARSLATILLEEVNREDGVARAWLDTEARIPDDQQLPRRKFCPVTGMEGLYTDPKTGIPFANLKALEQIRERAPPFFLLGGSLAYHEAVKSIRDE
jgi:hypothetical protein